APTDNTGATTATTAPTDNTGATTATTAPTDNTGATTATTAPTDNTGATTATTAPIDNTGATTTTAPTDNTGATTATAPIDSTGPVTTTAPTDTPPAVPSLAQNSPVLQPSGDKQDVYNPLAPVGQTSTFGEVWNDKPHGLAASRTLEGTDTDSASGSTTNHYKGYLDNSYLFNWTQQGFRADETVDAQGNLTHRKTVYVNDWGTPSLKFQTPDGPQNIDKVNSVESTRDAATGAWNTVIQDVWGKRWQAESAPDGRVTSFKPIDAAPADPVSLEITPWLGM
ncbi:MAG: hypothetical protein JSS83_27990, partial [Cyanobacteria bacterium SZAS LIN-3]|nr:hypothetical protein [Cyanobacteria bacterium SZAS LIN-3]